MSILTGAPELPAVPNYPQPNPYQEELEKARQQVRKELATDEDYKDMGENAGVRIFKKYNPSDPDGLAIVKGSTVVKNVTTDAIVPCTQMVGMRKRWDPQYVGGFMLERYSTHVFSFWGAVRGFAGIVDPRDFTGVAEAQGSGHGNREVLIVQTSTDTGYPVPKGHIRATVMYSGWHFLPQGNDVKVTHILKLALNGKIPKNLVRALAKDIPACVGHARDVFYKVGHPPYAKFVEGQTDTEAIFQTTDISPDKDLEYFFTFTSRPGAQFNLVYDAQKMYARGIDLSVRGRDTIDVTGVEVVDDGNGTVHVNCFGPVPETVTIVMRPSET
ncbi:Bet v1-like protein [Meredithblackwellia eburnea MCA 4105]